MISAEAKVMVDALGDSKKAVLRDLWAKAGQVVVNTDRALLTELVRLKVDIEAIDFAISHARKAGAAKILQALRS